MELPPASGRQCGPTAPAWACPASSAPSPAVLIHQLKSDLAVDSSLVSMSGVSTSKLHSRGSDQHTPSQLPHNQHERWCQAASQGLWGAGTSAARSAETHSDSSAMSGTTAVSHSA